MRARQAILLLLLALLSLGGLGAAAWWLLGREPVRTPGLVGPGIEGPAPQAVQQPSAPDVDLEVTSEPESSAATTVVFPLELELDLVRADAAVQAAGVPPLGSAASARLKGSVFSGIGKPVAAEVSFEAGPNQGRVLHCDASGQFGANDLYPGLAMVRVRGLGIPGSLRPVRLRQGREEQLNLGYGRLSEIWGEVQSRQGLPIAGAKVSFDGQECETDETGTFHFERMAAGKILVVVQKPGYASLQEELSIVAGSKIEKGRLRYAMDKGARVVIEVPERIRSDQQALVFLLPVTAPGTQRTYPWYLVNPVRVWPGGTATVEDLPPGTISLRMFHVGAQAKPAQKSVSLEPEAEVQATLHLEPAPTLHGVVRLGGQPVQRAEVSLEAADRYRATLQAFGETSNVLFVESEVLPDAPPAIQRAFTDGAGRFELSSWESVAKERYLVARYDGGRQIATRLLRGGEVEVDLDLFAASGGDGMLRLVLPDRSQALPLRVAVNGERRDPQSLPAGQDLRVAGLSQGLWKLRARWNGVELLAGIEVEVKLETALPLELPEGAIVGQDADTQKRAAPPR